MTCESLLMQAWNEHSKSARLEFLRDLAIPFPANNPVESAKQALLNLNGDEWQEVCDWLAENHWLPPGC